MRCVVFGDESTIPRMLEYLDGSVALAVVAGNRPRALAALGDDVVVHPAKSAPERPDFMRKIRQAKADLFLCFSYSMILDRELLALPRLGAINIHGALLPQFRGANALNWALIEDARESGVTAHYMTSGIDDGDIVLQERTPITDADTAVTLKDRLDEIGFRFVTRIHGMLSEGRPLLRVPQDERAARYYRRRKPEDGAIDWTKPEREIFNLIRALVNPWPGAFYFDADGSKVVIDRYLPLDDVRALKRAHAR